MVEKAAGRADENIGATLKLAVLIFKRDATNQKGDVQLVILAVFLEVFGYLCRQFAGRLEDQRARHSCACAAFFQQCEHRQNEGCGFPRAGLCDTADITLFESGRNCASLNGCRRRVAGICNSGKNFLAQAKIRECCQRKNFFRSGSVRIPACRCDTCKDLARGYAQIARKSRKQPEMRAKRRDVGEAFEPWTRFRAIYRKKGEKSVKIGLLFEIGFKLGPGDQKPHRINRRVVAADLVMYVRTGGAAGAPSTANNVAGLHVVAGFDQNGGEMAESRRYALAVIDLDHIAVAA